MGDRYYEQIGRANNLKGHQAIMEFCLKPRYKTDKRTKQCITEAIGISGLDKLTKEDLLWLEEHINFLEPLDITSNIKKVWVAKLSTEYPTVAWNKLTLKTIKEVFNAT